MDRCTKPQRRIVEYCSILKCLVKARESEGNMLPNDNDPIPASFAIISSHDEESRTKPGEGIYMGGFCFACYKLRDFHRERIPRLDNPFSERGSN